jgi:N utilization substance protein A
MAVISHDSSLDPVGPCIGMRGSRVQAVVGELQGEKIDIIQWSEDPASFIVNALAPAEVTKVVLDEEKNKIEIVVPDDQLSLAIGRRGQNVRLGSQLSGWDIDILTEATESERRVKEFQYRSQMYVDALDVDEVIAHLLVSEGFSSIEEVAFVPIEDLIGIEGFEEEVAVELRERAQNFLSQRDQELKTRHVELDIKDDMKLVDGITAQMMILLGEAGIKSRDNLADLAGDEFFEIVGKEIESLERADEIIMAARAHWFPDSDKTDEGDDSIEG